MGKDKTGKFHPGKGKPSGINKEESSAMNTDAGAYIEPYNALSEEGNEDEVVQHLPLRHRNRNTSKSENTVRGKGNNAESDKAVTDAMKDGITTVAEELPGILTKELFRQLATYESPCCISIFLGTHSAGLEINEHYDPVQFKNALQAATKLLKEKNRETAEIERLLAPGYELLRDDTFWLQQSKGLALFIANGYFKYIRMPLAATPDIVMENTFYVTPLIPAIISNEYFYLLVISKKQSKLFRGDAFGMEYVPVEGLPRGLAEEVGDTNVATTFRTGGRGGNGGANFHGIGGGNNNDDKAYLANYLESVDDVIWKQVLRNENVPLLLAGVEYLIPVYRSVCDYHNVYADALTGSHEHEDTPALYRQAREKMEPYFQQRVDKALKNYGNQSATQLTSSVIDDVIPAAYYARISYLFVQKNTHIWGTFDEATGRLDITGENIPNAQDLVDNAVVKTLLNGGEVFLLDAEKMPAQAPLAAIFRY